MVRAPLNKAYFQAITAGKVYAVPSNYFGSFSITAAQQHIFRDFEGHLETQLGNTQNKYYA